jgi:hypothetical protein
MKTTLDKDYKVMTVNRMFSSSPYRKQISSPHAVLMLLRKSSLDKSLKTLHYHNETQ